MAIRLSAYDLDQTNYILGFGADLLESAKPFPGTEKVGQDHAKAHPSTGVIIPHDGPRNGNIGLMIPHSGPIGLSLIFAHFLSYRERGLADSSRSAPKPRM